MGVSRYGTFQAISNAHWKATIKTRSLRWKKIVVEILYYCASLCCLGPEVNTCVSSVGKMALKCSSSLGWVY